MTETETDSSVNTETDPPSCRVCGSSFILRPAASMTKDQAWCGTWYDHPKATTCGNAWASVLYQSDELEAFLAEQRERAEARS